MQVSEVYSHRCAREMLESKGLLDEVLSVVDARGVRVTPGSASKLKQHVRTQLSRLGWAPDPKLHPSFKVDINAMKCGIGLTAQFGNIARGFYDLMKFQALHLSDRIDVAVLVVPSRDAARVLGSNLANYGRITAELELFKHVISVPCLVVAVDG